MAAATAAADMVVVVEDTAVAAAVTEVEQLRPATHAAVLDTWPGRFI